MKVAFLTKKILLKQSSDEVVKAGDAYIVDNLGYSDESKVKSHKAIILRSPCCRMDMASTSSHTITVSNPWWRRVCGLLPTINVSPMLQCPYVPAHRFKIKNSRVVPA